jgi:hypothetical protein
VLHQLELDLRVIACPQQLAGRIIIGPVLEAEAVGLAPACPEERDQLVMVAPGRNDLGRELRPARRAIRHVVRKPDLVETCHRLSRSSTMAETERNRHADC